MQLTLYFYTVPLLSCAGFSFPCSPHLHGPDIVWMGHVIGFFLELNLLPMSLRSFLRCVRYRVILSFY